MKSPLLEHILQRPDHYIGSTEKRTETLWMYDESFVMMPRAVTYVPGLQKIFDEILVNAVESKQRDPSMDFLLIDIDVVKCQISVYNNGEGIPVEVLQEEGVYVPELMFGHLTGTKKTGGRREDYGVKFTNVFSTELVVETADGHRLKKYRQVFSDNMVKKLEPEITSCEQGENWTMITFKPDLAKFNLTHLEEDVVALMKKRVMDVAATLGESVNVMLDGQRVHVKNFLHYASWYIMSASKKRLVTLPRIYEKLDGQWEVCVSLSEGEFEQVSFVNGIATTRGGSHVDYVANKIAAHVAQVVNDKKCETIYAEVHDVKRHMWLFVNARIQNPTFDSPTKDFLTTPYESFGSKCDFSDVFLDKIPICGVVHNMLCYPGFKCTSKKEMLRKRGGRYMRSAGMEP